MLADTVANLIIGVARSVLALAGLPWLGVVMVYNSSAVLASEAKLYHNDEMFFLKRQLLWLFMGTAMFLAASKLPSLAIR